MSCGPTTALTASPTARCIWNAGVTSVTTARTATRLINCYGPMSARQSDDDDLTPDAVARLGRILIHERIALRRARRWVGFNQVILLCAIGLNLGSAIWGFTHP